MSPNLDILYIDDDELPRALFRREAERMGVRVTLASSARQGLELAVSRSFAAIVSDLRMPGMEGDTLLKALREQGVETPFLFVTGVSTEERPLIQEPGVRFLTKPWRRDELHAVLDAVIDERNRSPRGGWSALIVEDNPGDRLLIERAVARGGEHVKVHSVSSLKEALNTLHEAEFDVVLTDLGLADAGGVSAVERLHRAAPEAALIVVSGNEDEAVALKTLSAGAQDFVSKRDTLGGSLGRTIRFGLERKRAERRLARLSEQDELTGLANRKRLHMRLADALSRCRRERSNFGLLYIDLDGFKPINDQWGHHVGDEILQLVANRLQLVMREYDACARVGGDEFAVLIETVRTPEDAQAAAARVIEELVRPYTVDEQSFHPKASGGLAVYPLHGATAEALIRSADEAMYQAKRAGGGRYVVASPVGEDGNEISNTEPRPSAELART